MAYFWSGNLTAGLDGLDPFRGIAGIVAGSGGGGTGVMIFGFSASCPGTGGKLLSVVGGGPEGSKPGGGMINGTPETGGRITPGPVP